MVWPSDVVIPMRYGPLPATPRKPIIRPASYAQQWDAARVKQLYIHGYTLNMCYRPYHDDVSNEVCYNYLS